MMGNYHVRFGEGLREKQVKLLALSLLHNTRQKPATGELRSTNWLKPAATR